MNIKFYLSICFILWAIGLNGQADELLIVKGNKTKNIELCDCLEITIHSKMTSDKLLEGSMAVTGYIQSMTSDTFYFNTEKNVFTLKNLDGNKWTKEINYLDERSLTSIAVADVTMIEHRSKGREFTWGMSRLAILVSTVTSFIVSPLVAYKFKDDDFDAPRYKRLVLPSLGVLAGSTFTCIISKPKKYYFQKEGNSDKQLWKFKFE